MKKRSLRNGAIVVVTLGALTGVGTMVANAATGPGGNQGRDNGNNNQADQRDGRLDPTASPSPFDPNFDPNRDPNADPSFDPSFDPSLDPSAAPGQVTGNNSCVDVQVAGVQQNGGQLCTTVEADGQNVTGVRVTLTAPDGACQGDVTLQASTDQGNVQTRTVDCAGTDRATATFGVNQQVADGALVCGILAGDDRFATARACVRVGA